MLIARARCPRQRGDKATIAHITTDFGQLDFLLVNQFPSRKVLTYNCNQENRSIAKASYINQKFRVKYADDIAEIWQNGIVLVLSHLQHFNSAIPQNINQIVVVCCKFKPNFTGFTQTQDQLKIQVFQRDETALMSL